MGFEFAHLIVLISPSAPNPKYIVLNIKDSSTLLKTPSKID